MKLRRCWSCEKRVGWSWRRRVWCRDCADGTWQSSEGFYADRADGDSEEKP